MIGRFSKQEIRKMKPLIQRIEGLRDAYIEYTDAQLKQNTVLFKERLSKGETLDSLLPEAFATVREASRRVLGIEHYPVQLMGGIALYHGHIAEMKTGEGKTAVAALPSYLMALTGDGVHVVTVNEYLAQRDAHEMGQVHEFLGLTVGCVLAGMKTPERQAAYNCDITYVTNTELGFDYLRDNMVTEKEKRVQRALHFAIIDEVDSILIDEARTPLIISGPGLSDTTIYEKTDRFVSMLEKGTSNGDMTKMDILAGVKVEESGDYIVDEKDKYVHLTARGVSKAEAFFHVKNLADPSCADIQHYITMALKAHATMQLDKDYIVRDGQVLIVDEFTGRVMNGRRYSDGLHQAIEAKEHVDIQQENHTLASITLQNFFNKYEWKSGMTGTAMTEEQEFKDIYHMRVISIPTNRPVIRKDENDLVFATKQAKFEAIADEIAEVHANGQPVLVGTASIAASEQLSALLQKKGLAHQVLNAKFHEKEAEIIAHAGEKGAVTIATNMAGRGTDIKLDEASRQAGGLYVIGSERHESRRIDNQLRGRSGRQGDPGRSRFFVSLEDDTLRLFIPEPLLVSFQAHIAQSNGVIEDRRLTKAITNAQKKIEGMHFLTRKNLTDFDAVNNEQRELIYSQRNAVLDGEDVSEGIQTMLENVVGDIADACVKGHSVDISKIRMMWNDVFQDVFEKYGTEEMLKTAKKASSVEDILLQTAKKEYAVQEEKFQAVDPDIMRTMERMVLLKVMDKHWMVHMGTLDTLRQNLSMVGYGQKDPVVEYRTYAYEAFDDMLVRVRKEVIFLLMHAQFRAVEPSGTTTEAEAS